MVTQMEKVAGKDDDTCETNDNLKTQVNAHVKSKDDAFTAAIEDYPANSARLNKEIANLYKEAQRWTRR